MMILLHSHVGFNCISEKKLCRLSHCTLPRDLVLFLYNTWNNMERLSCLLPASLTTICVPGPHAHFATVPVPT